MKTRKQNWQLAEEAVMKWEKYHGRKPEKADGLKGGYDIKSADPKNNSERLIEIKSKEKGKKTWVHLTRKESEVYQNNQDNYWLYLVEGDFRKSDEIKIAEFSPDDLREMATCAPQVRFAKLSNQKKRKTIPPDLLMTVLLLLASCLFQLPMSYAQGIWEALGPNDFNQPSYDMASDLDIAVTSNGILYVVYSDYQNDYKATVSKYHNGLWSIVGQAGFSDGSISKASIGITSGSLPCVSFRDAANSYKLSVMKFDGTNWNYIDSPGVSTDEVLFTDLAAKGGNIYTLTNVNPGLPYPSIETRSFGTNSIVIGTFPQAQGGSITVNESNQGNPFIAYISHLTGKLTVKRYDGNYVWSTVGNVDFSTGNAVEVSINTDNTGVPYVAYKDSDNGGKATVMRFDGNNWVTIGTSAFTAGSVSKLSLDIDNSGAPFVAYKDNANGDRISVMKFDGNNWIYAGPIGFSNGTSDFTNIVMDNYGVPFVVYTDYGFGGKAIVRSFNGTDWAYVGDRGIGHSLNGNRTSSIAIHPNGTPYAAFCDKNNGNRATVKKFDGNDWLNVGPEGFTMNNVSAIDLSFNSSGEPYTVYTSFNGSYGVRKFDGNDWIVVGSPTSGGIDIELNSANEVFFVGYGSGVATYDGNSWATTTLGQSGDNMNIEIDPTDEMPVVAGTNGASGPISVHKYNGSVWQLVGNSAFTPGSCRWVSLHVSSIGVPYVSYADYSNSGRISVMKFNGTNWVTVGSVGFSDGEVEYTSIVLDDTDTPYVFYRDHANDYRGTVKMFNGFSWVDVGSTPVSSGEVYACSMDIDANGSPYILYSSPEVWGYRFNSTITSVPTVSENAFSIYPNPATTNLTIESRTPLAQVWVRDVAGRALRYTTLPRGTQDDRAVVDLSGLPSGIYLVEVLTQNGQRSVQKVVVE